MAEGWGKRHFPPQSQSLETLLRYVFVLDTLNFCFWGSPPFQFYTLIANVRELLVSDPDFLSPLRLQAVTTAELWDLMFHCEISLLDERARMLQEVFSIIVNQYHGSCLHFVNTAKGDAVRLVRLIVDTFPCYRDQAIYKGTQVFFYKRAQILVADMHLAYCEIKRTVTPDKLHEYAAIDFAATVGELTMFADYRVPQLLRAKGILQYDSELAELIDTQRELPFSSPCEVEIRAAEVVVVEMLKNVLAQVGVSALALQIDVCLWQLAQAIKQTALPAHRTLTIFY